MIQTSNYKFWAFQCVAAVMLFALGAWFGFSYGHRMPRRLPTPFAQHNQGLQTITIKSGNGTTTLNRDAGTITKIQGNAITITDNANHQQEVLSDNSTIIMGALKEIGLPDLKTGQRISVDGILNQNGQLQARTIVER